MDDEMIERMAKAVLKLDQPDADYASLNDRGKDYYNSIAVAVAEAMREPTQRMRLAGVYEWSRPDLTSEHESTLIFNAVWRAMIDAIIKE